MQSETGLGILKKHMVPILPMDVPNGTMVWMIIGNDWGFDSTNVHAGITTSIIDVFLHIRVVTDH